jgi:hypothetical protein
MKHLPAFLLSLLLVTSATAQSNYIKGKVVHEATGAPVTNASVFITNTSRGTVSNAAGDFELTNVPEGTYDLIVSCIGFETLVYTYQAKELPLQIRAQLKPKAQELQTVFVEPFEKDGWKKWGQFFKENFIGTSAFAGKCEIKNYKTLRFRFSKSKNKLTVIADEPLIIENKALGYKVQYQLEEFSYSFKDRVLLYFGYTLFENLNNEKPGKRQLASREKCYNGSMLHFMSSLYYNQLAKNGFEVRRLVRTPNQEKERVRNIYAQRVVSKKDNFNGRNMQIVIGQNPYTATGADDSTEYYRGVMRQPDMLEEYGKYLLVADSLVAKVDSTHKSLFFNDYLYVVYKNEVEDAEYLLYHHETRGATSQRSVIYLTVSNPLLIDASGNYSPPQFLMSYGYWGWSEKIATLLPLDYKVTGDQ